MLDGPENVITLCATCHQNFDRIDDPGWIFHPTDIKYFIQFECHDRERRASERAAGLEPKRTVPNHETYLKHQSTQGLVPMHSIGGLYSPVIFKSFLHVTASPYVRQAIMEHITRVRPWHGAPIAAFRRTLASGSLRSAVFSDECISVSLKTIICRISYHRLQAMTGATTSVPPPDMMNIPMRKESPLAAARKRSVALEQL
jgi:hypothetical protein